MVKLFKNILENQNITTYFQPIVNLKTGEVIGYEALSRGPKDSPLSSPLNLLKIAEEQNKLWELELLFRTKAIEKAHNIGKNKLLFLNVDANIIEDSNFKKGLTKEFLSKYNISPKSIIFEITERTAIEDYKKFRAVLRNYTDQGYKIAIDDAGAGYSGLITISETKPNFIKIDMDLIRNIDKDLFKQAIIKAFVDTAVTTNIKLIAEGIETEEELKTLIKLGVFAGQGYFLQRPSENIRDIPDNIKELIISHNKISNSIFNNNVNYHYIGCIMEEAKSFSSKTPCGNIKEYLESNSVEGVCIAENDYPVGLIMKHNLNSVLAKQYGFAVFSKRPISLIMDTSPLVVDYYTPINTVCEYAMARTDEKVYDNIIITKGSKYCGIVSIKKLLQHIITIEKNYARELNPLTSLPGNIIINRVLNDTIFLNKTCCILYLDLDNFKAYNDVYGFENGDKVIKLTADIIKNNVKSLFPYNSFIGHIGGDDFICVIDGKLEDCENLCNMIIREFDVKILDFFNEVDRQNKYIVSEDRYGAVHIHNLTTISIALLYGKMDSFNTPDELGQHMSTLKKETKKKESSSYIVSTI